MKSLNAQKINYSQAAEMTWLPLAMPSLESLAPLTAENEAEVMEFLSLRPVHTVVMKSFILDNGLVSADNRGQFFGFRNRQGNLEGVALIGHTTLIEARCDDALVAFALKAKTSETPLHIIMSDSKSVERFWNFYSEAGQEPRLSCLELLFELNFPFMVQKSNYNLRPAKTDELMPIAEAHAEVAFVESGVNPMEKDREGYLKRTLKRIEKERTFVVFDGDKLVFKADIVAETSDVIYLEGIYVGEEYRGKGIGAECLAQVSLELMTRVENICLLSNVEFKSAHRSFAKAGFKNTDSCLTLFV